MVPTTRRSNGTTATLAAALLALAALLGSAGSAGAVVPPDFRAVRINLNSVASGLTGPVLVTNAHDGSHRLFIVEQRGVIKIWKSGKVLGPAFLDIRSKVKASSEQGLLALAFHPNYKHNHKFYVLYTARGTGDVTVAEFRSSTTNKNRAPATTYRRVLSIRHRTNTNHNGGMLAFGKYNGFLYISVGDGGGGGDVDNHAQSRGSLLGKMLRIDVDATSPGKAYRIPTNNPYAKSTIAKREIWARGLRNPWRFSFDRANGDLWIGDVGQGAWEEVDRATLASGGGRGLNFGWHVMEGDACYQPSSGCVTTGLTTPIAVYDHGTGCAIIGGYVYRGPQAILAGAYLFSDVCSGKIWSIVAAGPKPQTPTEMASTGLGITSFGEGESGTVYVTAQDGHVYRLSAAVRP